MPPFSLPTLKGQQGAKLNYSFAKDDAVGGRAQLRVNYSGPLKEAEDAGSGGTLWVPVAKEDALFMEHLWREDREGGRR